MKKFSVIIPAFNEVATLPKVLAGLHTELKDLGDYEIIVVDDGSVDGTASAVEAPVRLITHSSNRGHGAAIKSAMRSAVAPVAVIFDADGQHDPADVARLLERFNEGYDLVVGNRRRLWRQHNGRGNTLVSMFASFITGVSVLDLTSGLRVIRTDVALHFLPLVPDRFCFELTTTISCALNKYKMTFVDIEPRVRQAGQSKIRIVFDGFKFGWMMLRLYWIFRVAKSFPGRNK